VVAEEIAVVRAATSAPPGMNLFVVAPVEIGAEALHALPTSPQMDAARPGVDVGDAHWDDDDYRAKIDLAFELRSSADSQDVTTAPSAPPSSRVLSLDVVAQLAAPLADSDAADRSLRGWAVRAVRAAGVRGSIHGWVRADTGKGAHACGPSTSTEDVGR
jgi:hypothetical protein